ncbi:MAG: alpha/beta hydrolase [Anaerolineae bacterium]|nr:alpha/beta hydrolase [Anaerolineae bacterium]
MSKLMPADIITNGIRIHYYRTEKTAQTRARPSLVLLHGITDSGLCWPRVVKALAPEYDMILPDARGHGLSDKPATGYAPRDHAADVAGLIQGLGLERPILIGHSMGAGVSATVAALYPDLVSALVLEDPPWRTEGDEIGTPEEQAARAAEWRKEILGRQAKTGPEVIAQRKREQPKWADEEFIDWIVAKQQVSPEVTQYITAARLPWRDVCARIACPALLITADVADGAIVTPEVAAAAIKLMPQGRAVHIAGAGHNIRREQFAAYMTAVREFLAELG